MDYLVSVPYSVVPNASELISFWNSDPECSNLAVASPAPPGRREYAGEIVEGVLMVLGSVSGGVASNALYDLLANRLSNARRVITYRTTKFPDGTEVTEFTSTDE